MTFNRQCFAFFDIDKTITTKDSFFAFCGFLLRKRPMGLVRFWGLPWAFVASRCLGADRVLVKRAVLSFLKGQEEEQISVLVNEFIDTIMWPLVSEKALKQLEWHRKEGHHILLISASPEVYVKPFAEKLDVQGYLGTPTIYENGVRVSGPHCYGEEKITRLRELELKQKWAIDFENSYFYSDHHSDTPLLKLVGHPVAVNPTVTLKEIALENQWEIKDWI